MIMARHINEKSAMAMIDKLDDGMDDIEDTVVDNEEAGDDDDEDLGEDSTEDTNDEDDDGESEGGVQTRSAEDQSGNRQGNERSDNREKSAAQDEPSKNIRRQGNNLVDDKNNIVNEQGQIIAKAGTERRLFEKTQRLNVALDNKSQALAKYEAEDKQFDNLRGKIKSHGLSVDEFAEGINMVIAFKSDPIGTAKKVLESVLAMGHNVTDILGADAGNAIEMSAVSKMLDERLKPLIAPLENKRVTDEATEQAQRAWDKFCDENPYADIHDTVLDDMLGKNPGLTPQKAYNALRDFCYKRNLDFSQPLAPQIERMQSATNNKNTNRSNPPRTQKPFPNGSSARHSSINDGEINPNDDWASIIKKAVPGIRN